MRTPLGGTSPKLPLFITLTGDMSVYQSVQRAEQHFEAPEVEGGDLKGYDREGRLLRITVVKKTTRFFFGVSEAVLEFVKIECAEDEPAHAEALRTDVLDFLARKEVSTKELEGVPLSELLLAATAHLQIH